MIPDRAAYQDDPAARAGHRALDQQQPALTVHSVDAERGLLLIKGAVPGPSGQTVLVRSAARSPKTLGEEVR